MPERHHLKHINRTAVPAHQFDPPRRAFIRNGWDDGGKEVEVLGPAFYISGQFWYPVIVRFEDEDPTFYKSAALEFTNE